MSDLYAAAREWLSDLHDDHDPAALTDREVRAAVGRICAGGWTAFVNSGAR